MSFIDVWGNTFVPLLAGLPLLVLILFACCTCVDKTIAAARKHYIYYTCKPRTPRRVRFDCENPRWHSSTSTSTTPSSSLSASHSRLIRSNTSPRLSGLMAHSSYVQRNTNYRFNTSVHADRTAGPSQTRTVLEREFIDPEKYEPTPPSLINVLGYRDPPTSRRASTPTPTEPGPHYSRSKSPLETYVSHSSEKKQRRFSSPSSPSIYAYTHSPRSPRREESNQSSISYLPEVRAYLQFMEVDPASRQRSHSFSGRNSSRSSSRRSSRRSSKHRPRSRSPSPYALERTAMITASDDISNYSTSNQSFGRYLTPQGSSDQGSFKSPESATPDWLLDMPDFTPANFESQSNLSRSGSIRTSFI